MSGPVHGPPLRRPRLNGRRGGFLAAFGLNYGVYGVFIITAPHGAPSRTSMAWMPDWFPLWVVGALWIAAGVIALVSAFEPLARDRRGFQALAGVAAGWTLAYLAGWALGTAPRGYVSALIFSDLAVAVLSVSGMLNPTPRPRRVRRPPS